ncbi:AraC family transcriptional regulator [Paenibacillus sp. PAMC21692]|uniref:AraC family transcriptional regulator n=1 Tax=Paenibacillus sp. PAMC21692 TaxID=2762320 RepID=UPI00164CF4D2|nr:AraC family transcriptional regulator [Paenibacillus sp. PAMC21692]QNK59311.1 helix-turn-helix domain-containing protein [Paenibacillus sp. PAMC21692]
MKRLETIDFQANPFQGRFLAEAEPDYKGFFHSHPGIEILMIHEGRGTVTLPKHVYSIQPGAVFIFQPHQLHHVRAIHTQEHPYVRSLLEFDPVAIYPYLKPYNHLGRMLTYVWKGDLKEQAFPEMLARYPIEPNIRFYKEHMGSNISLKPERYASLVTQLLHYLQLEISQRSITMNLRTQTGVSHTEAILRWIEEHYTETFDLGQLADELHLSKYHISHLFKADTGRTVTEYIMALRSKEACRLLIDSPLSVAEVGVRVGWPIASHFTGQFKRWVGCTPSQYRKRHHRRLLEGR